MARVDADFSTVAKLLASPARSAIAGALMDGRALTGGELAQVAGVSASTASEHLAEMVAGGLVDVRCQGRHRYFALAGPEVAEALEILARICPTTPVRSLRASKEADALSFARTCYDHLAGRLGVLVLAALVDQQWLSELADGYDVTPLGSDRLAALDLDAHALRGRRRRFAYPCLDWTDRRPHLAGALAAGLTTAFLANGWLRRTSRHRGLTVTPAGAAGLQTLLGVNVDAERVLDNDHPARPA